MTALLARSLLLATLLHQSPAPEAGDAATLGVQLPSVEGYERVEATLRAHAEAGGVVVDVHSFDPAALELSALGPRSRELLEQTDADDVLWLVPEPAPMRLYLYEGSTGAVWTRRLDVDTLDAMATEVVSNVTVSIGLALQAGEIRDMEPVDPSAFQPESEPKPESEPPPESEPQPQPQPTAPAWPARHRAPVWLGVRYLGNTFSDAMPWQSAVGLRLTWKPRPRLAVWLRYAYVATQAVELGAVRFDLRRHPVTLGTGARIPLAPRLDVVAGGALAIDPVTRVLASNNPDLQVEDDGLRVHSSAIAYVGAGVHVAPRVRASLDVALDVLLTGADVVVDTPSGLLRHEPHRARLVLGAGLEVGLGPRDKD